MTARADRRGAKYVPIDELLAMPRIRVLRYMRHCDWVASVDIYVALSVGDHEVGNYNTIVSRLTREHLLDRRGPGINHYTYRLSEAGRAYLQQVLERSQDLPPLSDRELALEESHS